MSHCSWEYTSGCLVQKVKPCFLTLNITDVSDTSQQLTCVCVCVHRALFAYDGLSNKLKLADSGGKGHMSCFREMKIQLLQFGLVEICLVLNLASFLSNLSLNLCPLCVLSYSGWRGRAGGEVSHIQATIWTLQSGKWGDRRPPDRHDQLGEWQTASWGLAPISMSPSLHTYQQELQKHIQIKKILQVHTQALMVSFSQSKVI